MFSFCLFALNTISLLFQYPWIICLWLFFIYSFFLDRCQIKLFNLFLLLNVNNFELFCLKYRSVYRCSVNISHNNTPIRHIIQFSMHKFPLQKKHDTASFFRDSFFCPKSKLEKNYEQKMHWKSRNTFFLCMFLNSARVCLCVYKSI